MRRCCAAACCAAATLEAVACAVLLHVASHLGSHGRAATASRWSLICGSVSVVTTVATGLLAPRQESARLCRRLGCCCNSK